MDQALNVVEAQVPNSGFSGISRLSNLWDRAQALVAKVVGDVKPTLDWVAEQATWLINVAKDAPKTILARGLVMIALGIGLVVSIFVFPTQLGIIVAMFALLAIFAVIAYTMVIGTTILSVTGVLKGTGHE